MFKIHVDILPQSVKLTYVLSFIANLKKVPESKSLKYYSTIVTLLLANRPNVFVLYTRSLN